MSFRLRMQLAEAFGRVNQWYCSQAYGRKVDEPELLLIYFIKSGGAADFARRYDEAMGEDNRWFCAQFHCKEIRDPETLWNYYMRYDEIRSGRDGSRSNQGGRAGELSIAC